MIVSTTRPRRNVRTVRQVFRRVSQHYAFVEHSKEVAKISLAHPKLIIRFHRVLHVLAFRGRFLLQHATPDIAFETACRAAFGVCLFYSRNRPWPDVDEKSHCQRAAAMRDPCQTAERGVPTKRQKCHGSPGGQIGHVSFRIST